MLKGKLENYNTLQNFFLKSNTHTCTLPIRLNIESIENSPVKLIV